MPAQVMFGKPVAAEIKEIIKKRVEAAGRLLSIAILIVGNDPASHLYKDRIVKLAGSLGIGVRLEIMPETAGTLDVCKRIEALNNDENVTGILPMMPMPKHIDSAAVGALIDPSKDLDCMNPINAGEVFLGRSPWAPCTPRACMAILQHYGISLRGKNAVVVGRSNVVGKPMGLLLMREHATVTVCHSRTVDLPSITRQADVLVVAIGVPGFVKPDMVKEGAIVVDVGVTAMRGSIEGDVDPAVMEKALVMTPVPGGVGTVSSVMVLEALTRNV